MTSKRTPRLAALGLSVALLAAACGAGDTEQTTAGVPDLDEAELPTEAPVVQEEPATEPTAGEEAVADPPPETAASEPEPEPDAPDEPAGENQLPAVEVIDLATGDTVLLSSFAPADRPIVLWFWAPH